MGKNKAKGNQSEQTFCDICSLILNSEQQAQQHYSGKSHAKKLKAKERIPEIVASATVDTTETQESVDGSQQGDPVAQAVKDNMQGKLPTKRKILEFPCVDCGMIFNREDLANEHFASDKHAKKLKMIEEFNKKLGGTGVDVDGNQKVQGAFQCQFCNIEVNSLHQLEQHRQGQVHRNKLKAAGYATTPPSSIDGPTPAKKGSFQCNVCHIFAASAALLQQHMGSLEHQQKYASSHQDISQPIAEHVKPAV